MEDIKTRAIIFLCIKNDTTINTNIIGLTFFKIVFTFVLKIDTLYITFIKK